MLHTVNARIQQTNPTNGRTRTLSPEATRTLVSLTHAKNLLMTVDEASRVALLSLPSSRITSRISLAFPVVAAAISPTASYAVFVGQKMEVWSLPSSSFPEFGGWSKIARFSAQGTCVAWSPDETRIAVGSNRLVTVYTIESRQQGVRVKPLVLHGHREPVISTAFVGKRGLTTVSSDGVLLCWRLKFHDQDTDYGNREHPFADTEGRNPRKRFYRVPVSAKLASRHFLKTSGARTATCSFVRDNMAAVGMSNGVLALFELPNSMIAEDDDFDAGLFEIGVMRRRKRAREASTNYGQGSSEDLLDDSIPVTPFTDLTLLHALSISKGPISTLSFSETGDWVGLSSATGQILIWDWRAETYVLKQQSHLLETTSVSFSPDGSAVATGSKDGQVKLWGVSSGFCVATFTEHSAPVTALAFSSKDVVISASYDGSVRAFDLRKYRNFRTMVGPPPRRQFACVAVDEMGDLVAAGCRESFEVIVWSLRTGQILELLNGHKGPVSGVWFRPRRGTLATSSWDRTVRLWDMYERKGSCEILEHSKEVLDVAFRPDGKEFASCTASGEVILWNAETGTIVGSIDGGRDAARGRLRDSRTLAPQKGHFKSLCYTADGRFLLAGAASANVCIYHVSEGKQPTMISKVSVTKNQDFDGLLDELNSKNLSSGGHELHTIEDDKEDTEGNWETQLADRKSLPGAAAEEKLRRKRLMKAEINCVRASVTGGLWAAVSAEGVIVFGDVEDDGYNGALFDPTNLEVDITPHAAVAAAKKHDYVMAAAIALRLNERDCLNDVINKIPLESIQGVVSALPVLYLPRLLHLLSWRIEHTPHLELNLLWARKLMLTHGASSHRNASDPSSVATAMRVLRKACHSHSKRLRPLIDKNEHMMHYVRTLASRNRSKLPTEELTEA